MIYVTICNHREGIIFMDQKAERKLLYYDRFQRMPRHCNDEPIFHFMCKDVKTGVDFILGSCFLLMKHQMS